MQKVFTILSASIEEIFSWFPCDVCHHSAYWHGFDAAANRAQHCAHCACPSYQRHRRGFTTIELQKGERT